MQPSDFQSFLDVAISVLARKDMIAVGQLKDFLQALPSAKQREKVLAQAVLHFAENDPAVLTWIATHKSVLAPELDLIDFTRRFVIARLRDRGWIQGKDFASGEKGTVFINSSFIRLSESFSECELLLIRAVLYIDPSPPSVE